MPFIINNKILHNNQFGFKTNKSTSLAIENVLSTIISKINSDKK